MSSIKSSSLYMKIWIRRTEYTWARGLMYKCPDHTHSTLIHIFTLNSARFLFQLTISMRLRRIFVVFRQLQPRITNNTIPCSTSNEFVTINIQISRTSAIGWRNQKTETYKCIDRNRLQSWLNYSVSLSCILCMRDMQSPSFILLSTSASTLTLPRNDKRVDYSIHEFTFICFCYKSRDSCNFRQKEWLRVSNW